MQLVFSQYCPHIASHNSTYLLFMFTLTAGIAVLVADSDQVADLISLCGFRKGELPAQYLELPLVARTLSDKDCCRLAHSKNFKVRISNIWASLGDCNSIKPYIRYIIGIDRDSRKVLPELAWNCVIYAARVKRNVVAHHSRQAQEGQRVYRMGEDVIKARIDLKVIRSEKRWNGPNCQSFQAKVVPGLLVSIHRPPHYILWC